MEEYKMYGPPDARQADGRCSLKNLERPHLAAWVLFGLFLVGCGGDAKLSRTGPTPTPSPQIAFTSSRALDNSDGPNINKTRNLWIMNGDGSGATALTKLTSLGILIRDPVWSPDGTRIAFSSNRALDGTDAKGSTLNIWVVNRDGSDATALTKLAVAPSSIPLWSPDGSRILYASLQALDQTDTISATLNLWVMNADGSGAKPLTFLRNTSVEGWPLSFAWSPDGARIAYTAIRAVDGSDRGGFSDNVWIMNADGTNGAPLTRFAHVPAMFELAWSPDGTRIAFVSTGTLDGSDTPGTTYNVWVARTDGSGITPLTRLTGGSISFAPQWSPDGTRIVYGSTRALDGADAATTTTNLWVMNADGTGQQALTTSSTVSAIFTIGSTVTWSPDSSQIAFDYYRALNADVFGPPNIWTVRVDGTGLAPLTKLTSPDAYHGNPQYRPRQ